jgi:hypothetical protein
MSNLRIDAATGEVVQALSDRDVACIVLKGPALASWYPPDSERRYADGDVWVAPGDLTTAEDVLIEMGFQPTQDERGLPAWWQEHGSSWFREEDGGRIDLHRRLQGVGVDPSATWVLLWPRSIALTVGGVDARSLDEAARALFVTLHATHHGARDPRGLPHLRAALEAVDEATWREVLELAETLDALESLSTGLRLVPEGLALAQRIGVPDARSVRAALHAASPPPVALGFEQLASASWSLRIAILVRKVVPPPGFVRHWWPPATRSRRMLLLGYLYRPVWLIRRAPAGYRAWSAARREANSSL